MMKLQVTIFRDFFINFVLSLEVTQESGVKEWVRYARVASPPPGGYSTNVPFEYYFGESPMDQRFHIKIREKNQGTNFDPSP
jgi:hypothetical protein